MMPENNIDKLISIEEFRAEQTAAQKMRTAVLNMVEVAGVMKETFDATAEIHKQIALDRKAKYDAYIAAGFLPEQALELCKS